MSCVNPLEKQLLLVSNDLDKGDGKVELIGSVDKRNIGCVDTIGRQSPFVGNVLSENVLDAVVIGQISKVSFSNGSFETAVTRSHFHQSAFIKRSVLGPKRLIYFFMNNIFNLKRNCVLRTLKNSFAIF